MVLLGNRAGKLRAILQQPGELASGPEKQVHPHGEIGRVQQCAPVGPGARGYPRQSIVPPGGAGYRWYAQFKKFLEIVYRCFWTGEFQCDITPSQTSRHESSSPGILL